MSTPTDEPIQIPWPETLDGLRAAWASIAGPLQQASTLMQSKRKAAATTQVSTAEGIGFDKVRAIDASGLLDGQDEDTTDASPDTSPVHPVTLAPAQLDRLSRIVEALTNAGITRPCYRGPHPETFRTKDGRTIPVICYKCHAPSRWPGSPTKRSAREQRAQAFLRQALERLALLMESLLHGATQNVREWAKSAGIATDKVLLILARQRARTEYPRLIMGECAAVAYLIRHEPIEQIAGWLTEGGMPAEDIGPAIMSLALVTPTERGGGEAGTLLELGQKIRTAKWRAA